MGCRCRRPGGGALVSLLAAVCMGGGSTAIWPWLEPGLPRSIGFDPVSSPPFLSPTTRYRRRSGSRRSRWPCPGGRAAGGAAASRRRPLAGPAACTSRSCLTCSPSPGSTADAAGRLQRATPMRSTNTIPARQLPSGTRGRPNSGSAGSGGRSGAISRHNSSIITDAAMSGRTVTFRPDRRSWASL